MTADSDQEPYENIDIARPGLRSEAQQRRSERPSEESVSKKRPRRMGESGGESRDRAGDSFAAFPQDSEKIGDQGAQAAAADKRSIHETRGPRTYQWADQAKSDDGCTDCKSRCPCAVIRMGG